MSLSRNYSRIMWIRIKKIIRITRRQSLIKIVRFKITKLLIFDWWIWLSIKSKLIDEISDIDKASISIVGTFSRKSIKISTKILDDKLLFSAIWSQSIFSWNFKNSVWSYKPRNCIDLNDEPYMNT